MTTYWNFDKPVYKKKRFVAKFVKKAPIDCSNFAKNNIPNYDTITSVPEEFATMDFSESENLSALWSGMVKCKEFPDIYAPKATNISSMFGNTGCSRIPSVIAPNATNIIGILGNCENNTSSTAYYELGKIKVGKVDSCQWLFNSTKNIKYIISLFDTSYCTSFSTMFGYMLLLELVPWFSTRRGQNFTATFSRCQKLPKIDKPIDLRCATTVEGMLYQCNSLVTEGIQFTNVPRTLDLSNIFQDGTDNSNNRYKIINYIETALNPDDVRDDDPDKLS